MDPIHYSCYLGLHEATAPVIPGLEGDGFVLYFSIQTRSAMMNDGGPHNLRFLQRITEDPNPTTRTIYVPRLRLLSETENGLSVVLGYLELPEEEHGKLVTQIRQFAANMDSRVCVMKAIIVDITNWSIVTMMNNINIVAAENESEDEECTICNESEDEECSICFEHLSVESEATDLACQHRFHLGCILQWLSVNPICPICRFEVEVEQ